jgi:hypothetical protein
VRVSAETWATILVPGGASGVRLKSKFPKSEACAEREGWMRDDQRRLKVRVACGRRRSHSDSGNFESTVQRMATK